MADRSTDVARVVGLDTARAVAVIGMIAVNVGPSSDIDPVTSLPERLYSLPHGRASVLFVVLAGIGITLLTRRARLVTGGPGQHEQQRALRWSLIRIGWRAVVLLLLGLTLQLLDHNVNVILQVYAVLFLVGAVLIRVSDRTLLIVSGSALAIAPPLWILANVEDIVPAELTTPLPQLLDSLLISGPYPVLTWLAPFVFGMWLGRQRLGDLRVQRTLVIAGVGVAVIATVISAVGTRLLYDETAPVGPTLLITDAAHGQMPLWTISSAALGAAVLGASLWVTPRLPRLTSPFVATGQLALTVYVAHLLVLTPIEPPADHTRGGLIAMGIVIGSVLFAALWHRWVGRGPVEHILRVPELLRTRQRR